MTCVQRDSWVDIVLRCMEDEFDGRDDGVDMVDTHVHFRVLISEMWIGGVYETIRLLADRRLAPDSDDFRALAHDLRLLRIPLEKHEVAGDRQLTEPLKFAAHPTNKNSAKVYEYDKADPRRVHVMPRGFSGRGSATWMVLDVTTGTPSERWIERLGDGRVARFEATPWRAQREAARAATAAISAREPPSRKPITGNAPCCARAASGQAIVALRVRRSSRRLIAPRRHAACDRSRAGSKNKFPSFPCL
jgi:hypothetical protein